MLAAVESDPSDVVGYVKYQCLAGNNMIALPLAQAFANASEVGDAIGATTVAYFNATAQEWVAIDAFPWGGWTDDFPVTNGQPLWISVDADVDFFSIGDLPAVPTYNLLAGNNTIMIPLNRSDLDLASEVGDDIGATTIAFFDATSQEWIAIDAFPWGGWTDEFNTSIGSPLWISVDSGMTWPAGPPPSPRQILSK